VKKNPEAGPVNTSVGPVKDSTAHRATSRISDLFGKIVGNGGYHSRMVPDTGEHADPRKAAPAYDPLTGEKTAPGQL